MLPTLRDQPAAPRHEGLLAASAGHRRTRMSTWARAALDRREKLLSARPSTRTLPAGPEAPSPPSLPRISTPPRGPPSCCSASAPTVTTGWVFSSGPTR
jgi:hypothetical protein